MLGVIVNERDLDVAAEFFELFKTPWELARTDRRYEAVLCTDQAAALPEADVTIVYGAAAQPHDRDRGVTIEPLRGGVIARVAGTPIPLYMGAAAFGAGRDAVTDYQGRRLDYRDEVGGRVYWRIGYDLFGEVEHVLKHGQPAEWAATPTLDLHIDLLRRMLVDAGASFLEVRPAPLGHSFACCLTHDVDFFGIRRHRLDATLAGFLARAGVGSLIDLARGRRTLREAGRNWMAVLSLPLVLMGLRPDFWDPVQQYLAADDARPATYFVVPTKAHPGVAPDGRVHEARAVKYEAGEIATDLRTALDRGHEVAVHGLDAWRDQGAALAESARVAAAAGATPSGIRMHWLYFDDRSPERLVDAGFDYDSTWGYNDAVGFRAGTAQAFRWPGCRLMELPLAIMDTALFFSGRLGLTRRDAMRRCIPILDHAVRAGGAVVVNWHDRSLAPERQWDAAYEELLGELDHRAPWYATASHAVAWFNWRRSITFTARDGQLFVDAPAARPAHLPGGVVREHRAGAITDHPLQGSERLTLDA